MISWCSCGAQFNHSILQVPGFWQMFMHWMLVYGTVDMYMDHRIITANAFFLLISRFGNPFLNTFWSCSLKWMHRIWQDVLVGAQV